MSLEARRLDPRDCCSLGEENNSVCLFVCWRTHSDSCSLWDPHDSDCFFLDYRNFANNLTSSTTTFTDWVMQNVILDVLENWDLSFDNQLLLRRKILMFWEPAQVAIKRAGCWLSSSWPEVGTTALQWQELMIEANRPRDQKIQMMVELYWLQGSPKKLKNDSTVILTNEFGSKRTETWVVVKLRRLLQ